MIKRTLLSARAAGRAFAAIAIAAVAVLPAAAQELSPKLAPYADIQGAEKVSLRLLDAVKQAKSAKSALGAPLAGALGLKSGTSTVSLELVTGPLGDQLLNEIRATGVVISSSSSRYRRVNITTSDPDAVEKLAAITGVTMIRLAPQARTHTGKVEGYGDVALGSNVGSAKYGLTGKGTMVGILSDSFATTEDVFETDVTDIVNVASHVELTAQILPNLNYTLVCQSSTEGEFELKFSTTGAAVLVEPDPEIGSSICASRSSLAGTVGTVLGQTTGVPDTTVFLGGSCAPGNALQYRAYGFKTNAPGTVTFSVDSRDARDFYLSLRPSCLSLAGERCAQAEQVTSPPTLVDAINQKTGDLPANVIILADMPFRAGGADEGAGMGELVHDIAPDAAIAFHTAFVSESNFAEGILKLGGLEPSWDFDILNPTGGKTITCDAIVDDVGYFREPVYQTGIVASAVEEVVESGIPYFSAAGNGGNVAIRSVYRDVSPGDERTMPPKGKDLHKWDNGTGFLPITVPPKEGFYATLQWNQPSQSTVAAFMGIGGGLIPVLSSRIDLDMYVTFTPDAAGLTEVFTAIGIATGRFSKELQGNDINPSGDAYEEVRFYNESEVTKTVYIAIDHYDGQKVKIPQADAPLEFTLNFIDIGDGVQVQGIDRTNPASGASTIFGHPLAKGAMAVGAVNYFDTPNFDTNYRPTAAIDPESFTSKGGEVTIYFDASGAPVRRHTFKPDIAAPDGNNTTFFGGADFDLDDNPNFFGTSAAAPNAAAVSLLLQELNNNLNPEQVRAALEESAIDVTGFGAGPGVDNTTGAGLIDALKALDYVAQNYGIGVGSPAPHDVVFSFPSTDGWEFQSPAGFTAPGSAANGHALVLTATGNTNTLGWWRSPEIIANSIQQPGFVTVDGQVGPGSVYRVTYVVSNGAESQAVTPTFRFRASPRSFEQTSELVISSVGNAALPPEPGTPKTYRQFFSLPATQSRFRLYFDLLGFTSSDSATASISLENVQVDAFDTTALLEGKREKLYLFATGTNGWTSGSGGSDLGKVDAKLEDTGLTLGPVNDPSKVSFGFFSTPLSGAPATLESNRVYCAKFRVKSNIAAATRDRLPSFRLRANDSSNQLAAVLNVNSTSISAETPSEQGYVDYRLYFAAPEELVGNKVRLSIDYLYVPGVGDDPTQTITLQTLALDSYFPPITN